ncbi:alpha/beta fold hydrolase [Flavimarina sp. Hel_I_48]|uniref:alpha/beta fold hydrolase n=1 Tax=Flavimarina sp. Hel_I_48 TaxID=1392488 RepID=UPI0004DF3E35|nr:alpha/beta hydrolase [Flavimarina sp. Hel_I_48]
MKKEQKNDCLKVGNGDKNMVFVHYFGGNAESWQWLAEYLKNDFTCYLINLPGFGNTEPLDRISISAFAENLEARIKALKLDTYILCGHSMGAKIVAYAAARSKNPPQHLLLIAPSPPTVEKMPVEEKKRMLKHPDRQEAITTVSNATVAALNDELFQHAVASQLEIDDKTWDWWLETGMNNDVSSHIKKGNTPTTIVCSQDDPVIPMKWIEEEVKPYFNDPKVVVLKKIGHLIPMEAPKELADIIINTCKQVY